MRKARILSDVISKWGNNGLFIHAIDECPYTYAILNPDVDYFNY